MARVRVPIAFTSIDRWLIGLIVVAVAAGAGVLSMSQKLVAPRVPASRTRSAPRSASRSKNGQGRVRIVSAVDPARRAGLRGGDTITAIDEAETPSLAELTERIAQSSEGDVLKVQARRRTADGGETGILADVTVASLTINPGELGLPFEDVSLRNEDGLTLRGWYLPPPADDVGRAPAIAYGHDSAGRSQGVAAGGPGRPRRRFRAVAVRLHRPGRERRRGDLDGLPRVPRSSRRARRPGRAAGGRSPAPGARRAQHGGGRGAVPRGGRCARQGFGIGQPVRRPHRGGRSRAGRLLHAAPDLPSRCSFPSRAGARTTRPAPSGRSTPCAR